MHRLVRFLVNRMNEQKVSIIEMAERTGHSRGSISAWINGRTAPSIHAIEDCLNVLGFVIPRPREGDPAEED